MAISYEDALATLNSMFGSPWKTDTLDAVLRHFEGHMENTIEAILAHGDGDPDELLKRLASGGIGSPPGTSGTTGSISVDEEIARQIAAEEEKRGRSRPGGGTGERTTSPKSSSSKRPKPKAKSKGRGTPTELPTDFLRIPGYKHGSMDSDERLARMLQDEMLQQELGNNPEFAHLGRSAAGRRPPGMFGASGGGYGGARQTGANASGPFGGGPGTEGPNIMDKLSEMGEQAKRRLALFAAQFNAQRENMAMNPNERQNAVQERRGLLDGGGDEDEEQVSFLGGGGGSGGGGVGSGGNNNISRRAVEMKSLSSSPSHGNKKMD